MPELPEVETTRRGLIPMLEGRVLTRVETRVPALRQPLPANLSKRLKGRRVMKLERRAKYILMHLDNGEVILLHLGMSGRITLAEEGTKPAKHDHVIFHTDKGQEVRFNDARRFGVLLLLRPEEVTTHPLLASLGPEPLSRALTPKHLLEEFDGRRTSLKAALLDQRVVAGLGNIYVSEALFHARLDPRRQALTVTPAEAKTLVAAIRKVLEAAVKAGGTTLRDYKQASGELGYFQHHFAVYGKAGERCPDCICALAKTGGIQRIVQEGRSTFLCATKQK